MKVKDIINILGLKLLSGVKGIDKKVKNGYCGDLLSDVMAHAPDACIWITIQTHQNIVAVAKLREISAIIIAAGHEPDIDTKQKAEDEGIPLLISSLSSFSIAGRLYELGIGR